jgi:hypothetical protein
MPDSRLKLESLIFPSLYDHVIDIRFGIVPKLRL